MRQPLVAGNWKLNGRLEDNQRLLEALRGASSLRCEVAVCPPFVYLPQARDLLAGYDVALGAQDVSRFEAGAYTGEVSAAMLAEFDIRYALVGHSERRRLLAEHDETVAEKAKRLVMAGIRPLVCVGETLDERDAHRTEAVVLAQMEAVLNAVPEAYWPMLVLAYEPVWAIGTGLTASPQQAQAVHAVLRERVAERSPEVAAAIRILYGGSMKPDNARDLLAMPDVDGGLIGGASLKAEQFLAICEAAS